MKKMAGYVLIGAGILVFLASMPQFRTAISLTLPEALTDLYITIIAGALLIAGAFLTFRTKSHKTPHEVPIYHGDTLVGFRRVAK